MKPLPDKVTTQNNVCKMLSKWDPIHDYSYWKHEHKCTRQGLEGCNKH